MVKHYYNRRKPRTLTGKRPSRLFVCFVPNYFEL